MAIFVIEMCYIGKCVLFIRKPHSMTSVTSNSTNYQYQYNAGGSPNGYYPPYAPYQAPQRSYVMNAENNANTTISGGLPYNQAPKKSSIKGVVKKILSPLKKIRPAHIITIGMFGFMFLGRSCMYSGAGNSSSTTNKNTMEWLYKKGEQHIRDSVRTAELEKELKLAQDSIKMLKKLPK